MTARFFMMPEEGMDTLIAAKRSGAISSDIYIFTLSNAEILGALRKVAAHSVTVRALVDMHPSGNRAAGQAALNALPRPRPWILFRAQRRLPTVRLSRDPQEPHSILCYDLKSIVRNTGCKSANLG